MAIRNWHTGKIIMLWVWALVLMGLSLEGIKTTENVILGFVLIGALFCLPLVLSVITWKWLGGKEQ
jgi:hypothetical protein